MSLDRLNIVYTLTFASSFHFGTGTREGLVDRTVVRDANDYLYVPGSTFKGMLREYCEQLARLYGLPGVDSPHDRRAALLRLGQRNPAPVTRIFGAQHLAGRLFFDDAHQSTDDKKQYDRPPRPNARPGDGKGEYKSLQVSQATQVRLDRLTGTAVPGALYTSEFGNKDMTFVGTIQGWLECTPLPALTQDEVTPTYSLLLLLAGLRMVERIGGNKSTGKGQCACAITSMEVNDQPVSKETREYWLSKIDVLAGYGKEG